MFSLLACPRPYRTEAERVEAVVAREGAVEVGRGGGRREPEGALSLHLDGAASSHAAAGGGERVGGSEGLHG